MRIRKTRIRTRMITRIIRRRAIQQTRKRAGSITRIRIMIISRIRRRRIMNIKTTRMRILREKPRKTHIRQRRRITSIITIRRIRRKTQT